MNFENSENKNINFPREYKALIIIGALILLIVIIGNLFIYTVDEREQVVVKQFDEVIKIIVSGDKELIQSQIKNNPQLENVIIDNRKGLHFKMPFIQNLEYFTSMKLTYDTDVREVITKDQKKLVLDSYAVWRISNPALFAISIKSESAAHTRLDDVIYSKLNQEIGKVEAHVVIADKGYVGEMLKELVYDTNMQFEGFGMELIDVKIKRTDLPEENYNNIFTRMKTDREKDARTYRSEGMEEAQKIRSQADMEAIILEAQAYQKAEEIKGEGDAEALRIYAEAYNKDPEFYAFTRSLLAYSRSLSDKTTVVIDSDSELTKYLFGPGENTEEE